VELVPWDAVVSAQMPLRLVPEVVDAVDVIAVCGKEFRVVDPDMVEVRDVQDIVGPKAIREDDTVRPYLVVRELRGFRCLRTAESFPKIEPKKPDPF
jgi:hypothetical protein